MTAHDEAKRRAVFGKIAAHITHRDRAVDAGAEATGGDHAQLFAAVRDDLGALTSGRAAFRFDAGAEPRWPVF